MASKAELDESKIVSLEDRKLDLQSKIIDLKAEVFKIDHEMLRSGATSERISRTMRW